jgi:hypothetical protein
MFASRVRLVASAEVFDLPDRHDVENTDAATSKDLTPRATCASRVESAAWPLALLTDSSASGPMVAGEYLAPVFSTLFWRVLFPTREAVHQVQSSELAPTGERILGEVHGPDLVRAHR